MRTEPLRIAIIWSPGEPIAKTHSPASKVRIWARAEIADRSLWLKPLNRMQFSIRRRAPMAASFCGAAGIAWGTANRDRQRKMLGEIINV